MKRLVLIVACAVALAGAGGFLWAQSYPRTAQPIDFNHKKHLEVGAECATCHEYFTKYAVAGLPDLQICLVCHVAQMTEEKNPEEEKVRAFSGRGQKVRWVRLYRLPQDIVFSHKEHIVRQINCAQCHGDIEKQARLKNPVKVRMEECIACHEREHQETDCLACHK